MELQQELDSYLSQAESNLLQFKENSYPGRIIIAGMNEKGDHLIQVYALMGRSPGSRNRYFIKQKGGILRTKPVNEASVENPELTIYTAMKEERDLAIQTKLGKIEARYAVSNGRQTNSVFDSPNGLEESLRIWQYEPDSSFTPRITSLFTLYHGGDFSLEMSILKKGTGNNHCERLLYAPAPIPGYGHCIHTYKCNGKPLPPFEAEPYLLPLRGSIKDVLHTIWGHLNEENRVSLAVKFINMETKKTTLCYINKHKKAL
jgi:IMP cyclohydrolase